MASQPETQELPLTETDRQNLAGGDEMFVLDTWDDLKRIIADGDISVLKRKPSDLLRYIQWSKDTKASYGSTTNFLIQERLKWQPTPDSSTSSPSGPRFVCESDTPFASSKDYQILLNDWPYGIEPNITHIVVWLKNRIAVQPPEGFLPPESKQLIEAFVQRVFVDRLRGLGQGQDQVLWFKNWVSLQSVRALDHIHVMVRDAPRSLLEEWTQRTT